MPNVACGSGTGRWGTRAAEARPPRFSNQNISDASGGLIPRGCARGDVLAGDHFGVRLPGPHHWIAAGGPDRS